MQSEPQSMKTAKQTSWVELGHKIGDTGNQKVFSTL